ncbi:MULTISPECIES: LacI family DNA-binding transcriptional regulator [Peribacillus]|uniref:LacI family DNA-binding transcriptional regulator n=1 Tax=Peribacillus TaxID=2675229 RepID=UPI0019143914|nr:MULTISPECIES: LacI family DNA-binding transcriptional regulator [unclassified Peribacillus]MBK5441752.1 LacI family DNA-binding transcriptional regulator [Peribacillus sp. TH24]WMX53348.1 LacI family DNA-binding transcriptional regulator [Peribacillus sp. R9-11]
MEKKVTIRDVAAYTGVSRTTVSNIVNGINKTSEETKEKVLKAIKELNYQPDFTAISLSKKKSNIIGVVIPTFDDSLAPIFRENHYYTEILGGMEYVFKNHNYDLFISGMMNPIEFKNWIQKRNLDGLIFLGLFPESVYNEIKTLDIPIVLIDNYEKHGVNYPNIRIDDELGGYIATKHLIDMGHKRISFMGHDLKTISVDEKRLSGYIKALQEANLSLNEDLLFDGTGSFYEVGFQMGLKLLELGDKATAIFATSDILAVGIIKALLEHGKKVPKDYSIVGFDDLVISRYSIPSLTTISQNVFNKGVLSAQTILNIIEHGTSDPVSINLPIELIVRKSTSFL